MNKSESTRPLAVDKPAEDATAWLHACLSPASFWVPERIETRSPGLEHAPFVFWLIEALRPRTLVDLGAQEDALYFTFREAVERCNLDTSTLVRPTDAGALERFGVETIDLLHIDARHVDGDVKNVLDTWRTKLSARSIVLLSHGGVSGRLLQSLPPAIPRFEFVHAGGLSVLGTGGSQWPVPVRALFAAAANPAATLQLRTVYGRLGEGVSIADAHDRLARAETQLARASAESLQQTSEFVETSARLQSENERIRREYHRLVESTSWRVTRPLRLFSGALRKLTDRSAGADSPGPRAWAEDLATLRNDPMFDPEFYFPPDRTRTEGIVSFLDQWRVAGGTVPSRDYSLRRPCAGFHPYIYAQAHADAYDTQLINPLAHFIRRGKPAGPWCHDVITPAAQVHAVEGGQLPPTALHVHFHYPELVDDFLRKIATNTSRCDLLLSTDEAGKSNALSNALSRYRKGEVEIRVVPNRGRDIGAFLTAFGAEIVSRYEIIGHFHSKRSLHGGGSSHSDFGDRWREFLWQHLLGNQYSMMDIILKRLTADASVGIVFPEDPYLHHWDANRANAEKLAARMRIAEPLPAFFDFPIGMMFWARTAALKPLFDLKLGWDDYPHEPIPPDGTILHAIERLLPFVARQAGYRFITTHVPGVRR